MWIGFSFADQRISAVLREVTQRTGTRIDPGGPARHVAIMAWDPAEGRDPQTLRDMAEIEYGADLILYPAPEEDPSALQLLLSNFVVGDYPPAPSQDPIGEFVPSDRPSSFVSPGRSVTPTKQAPPDSP